MEERRRLPVDTVAVRVAKMRADVLIEGIVGGEFPERPETLKCMACDMGTLCKHAVCGKCNL